MDDRDRLAFYPFVLVRIACRVYSRSASYRLGRLAAKFGPEISLRDLPDRFSCTAFGGKGGQQRRTMPVAFTYRTLSKNARPIYRPALRR